ncbi:reverse transcriptase domain-containing protein [Tanacetum coccineum]
MMSAKKRVGLLHTHRLAVRHSVDYSFSHHFALDDSLRDSSSSSSSKTSSNPSSDDLSDSSSDHSLPASSSGMRPSHHLCSLVPSIPHSSAAISDRPSHDYSSASPSHKRSRSPVASVPLSSPIPGALSSARADLLPSPKRIRSQSPWTDFRVDGIDIDPEIQAEIDECIAYADALRVRGIDARVVVKVVDQEEIETGTRGPVEVRVDRVTHPVIADDIAEPTQEEGAVEDTYVTLGDLGHRIVATGQQSPNMLERIRELERDNMRLRDMIDVVSHRVTRSQRQCLTLDLEHQGYVKELTNKLTVDCNCPEKYQVKYSTCTLLNNALTWWNSYKRTIGIVAAYAMSWEKLMKLMIEELVLLYTRMVPNEEDKVERFIRGLPDNIQGNVIAAEPTKLQDAIRIANNLMDQKLEGYARSAKNKRRLDNNPRDNRGQQPVFKRQKLEARMWQKLTRLGTMRKRGMLDLFPTATSASCTMQDHRAPVGNQPGIICYECGRPRNFRKYYPKLRNQNRGNKTGSKNGNKTENQTGGNEATVRAYAIRGGGANLNSNVVMGTFLLNNCYASMLFDSGADRSFVSSTFSALLDVAPSTLDTSYAIELADGRISKINVVLRSYTLGSLGHPFDIDLIPVELGSL